MRQTLNVEIQNYNITITDDKFSKFFDEINQTAQIDQNLKEEEKKIFLNYAKGIL